MTYLTPVPIAHLYPEDLLSLGYNRDWITQRDLEKIAESMWDKYLDGHFSDHLEWSAEQRHMLK